MALITRILNQLASPNTSKAVAPKNHWLKVDMEIICKRHILKFWTY